MAGFTQIPDLGELIKNSITGEVVKQTVERLVPPGENFGSVIYKVDFKVKNGESEKTYHGVAKCTPPNKVTQEIFKTQITFKSEIGWYTSVIPTLKQFQRDHGVEQVADFFQNFYGARISLDPNSDVVDENAVILTENLITLGYKNANRHVGFDLNTSKAVLRDLASFHAIPLALKQQNNDLFEKKIKPFLPKMTEYNIGDIMDTSRDIKDELAKMPELEPYLDRVFKILNSNQAFNYKYVPSEPWATVCHADFWTNNIMVREEEKPKTIILDLQTPIYGSLAGDIIFFLSLSVALDTVKEYMDELIKHYWDQFLRNLKELGSDTVIFSYEEFEKELSAQAKREMGHAMFIGQFVLMEKGYKQFDSSNENSSKEDFTNNKIQFNQLHKDRFTWLITEFVKRNWI